MIFGNYAAHRGYGAEDDEIDPSQLDPNLDPSGSDWVDTTTQASGGSVANAAAAAIAAANAPTDVPSVSPDPTNMMVPPVSIMPGATPGSGIGPSSGAKPSFLSGMSTPLLLGLAAAGLLGIVLLTSKGKSTNKISTSMTPNRRRHHPKKSRRRARR